jgi:hypothetical protein
MAGEDKATVEDRVADVHAPMTINVDDFDLGGVDEDKEKEVSSKEDKEVEIEIEGKESKVEKEESELTKLQKQVNTLTEELLKVSTRKPERVIETKEEKKEKLTQAQLVGIIKENKDKDNFPEILANVMAYIAEDTASSIKNKTMEEVSHNQWKTNLSGKANRILSEDPGGYLTANPKIKSELPEMAKNLGLADHPVGELAAYGIYKLLEDAKAKDAKVDKLKSSSTNNSSRVMDKTRVSSQTGKVTLTPEQIAVAKKFGVKPETYAMFVRKS